MNKFLEYLLLSVEISSLILILVAGFLFFLHYMLVHKFQDRLGLYKIQPDVFSSHTLKNDILYTVLTIITAVFMITGIYYGVIFGIFNITWMPDNVYKLIVEVVLYFLFFDAIYYFMHRLLHIEPFYSLAHIHHHRTTAPNMATTLAFHPIETTLIIGIFLFSLTVLNFHLMTVVSVMIFFGLYNFFVHCGHDFFPRSWYDSVWTGWLITPLFHDNHHSKFNNNFGALTVFWDTIMKTISPDLRTEFSNIHDRAVNLSVSDFTQKGNLR